MFILLMHFRLSICQGFDSGLLSRIYIHCNTKGGNQRVWERWMRPVLLAHILSCRIIKMSNGDLGWVETRVMILQSHFPDRFLEVGEKCGNSVMKMKAAVLCVCAHECSRVWESSSGIEPAAFVRLRSSCTVSWDWETPDCPTAEGRGSASARL